MGELFVLIQCALREGDTLALGRHVYRLDYALRDWNGWMRRFVFTDADLDEARQRVLLRIYAAAQSSLNEDVRAPQTYAMNAAAWELKDLARERRRHRVVAIDDDGVRGEVEESGVHAMGDLLAKLEGERVLEEARSVFHAYFEAYLQLAGASPSPVPRNQLRAWLIVRVQGRSADEAAQELNVTHLADAGRQTVWQWARRGRDLVARIAASDPDARRAQVMRGAAAEAG